LYRFFLKEAGKAQLGSQARSKIGMINTPAPEE
jgi:hypothetical protein